MTAPPPAVDVSTKKDILAAANSDALGQSAPGTDGGNKDVPKKVKTEKELEKERKKAEKDAKFKAKKAAQAQAAKSSGSQAGAKEKKKKEEKEVLPEYEETTPKGEKKALRSFDDPHFKAYIPKAVESGWYDWWEKEGFFKPELVDGKVKEPGHFVIPIPPPKYGSLPNHVWFGN